MTVQWYPGHMAKARRLLTENLALVDIVVEICDARLPYSSRNPEIDYIIGDKPRILLLNKADLGDASLNLFWKKYYTEKGMTVVYTDSRTGDGVRKAINEITIAMKEKLEKKAAKGRINPVIHAMIVGIPNVGKSSFINRIAGKNVAITGDRPGVTRDKQWIHMNENIYLLDTPGMLWPKIENQLSALKLVCSGAVKDDVTDRIEDASFLAAFLAKHYPDMLCERFKVTPEDFFGEDEEPIDSQTLDFTELFSLSESAHGSKVITLGAKILEACGRKRGCLIRGNQVNMEKIAVIMLDEFRAGMIGRISLDLENTPLEDSIIKKKALEARSSKTEARKKREEKRRETSERMKAQSKTQKGEWKKENAGKRGGKTFKDGKTSRSGNEGYIMPSFDENSSFTSISDSPKVTKDIEKKKKGQVSGPNAKAKARARANTYDRLNKIHRGVDPDAEKKARRKQFYAARGRKQKENQNSSGI